MRIAFVVNNYPPRTGGVETHVQSLARALSDEGHDVLVVTLADQAGASTEDGVSIVRLREHARIGDVLGFPSLGATRRIARLLQVRNVEVVSVHTRFFPMTWVGLRAARRAGAAVVHTEHGSDHVVSPSRLIALASRVVDLTIGRMALRRADEVLAVSESAAEFVRRLSGISARVFYNAIDPSPPAEDTSAVPTVDRLVFVGRLVAGKGADTFVDLARSTGMHAVILGDGPERPALEARVREAGISDRVTLLGRVSQQQVRRELRGGILVNPTTLAEGFQTTLLEALDVGARVATFDVPGAALLATEGFPVIVTESTADALAVAVGRLRREEPEVGPLLGWYWADRVREYEAILAKTLQGSGERSKTVG